jgi:hypothetical protein
MNPSTSIVILGFTAYLVARNEMFLGTLLQSPLPSPRRAYHTFSPPHVAAELGAELQYKRLVEALLYSPERCGFDSRYCHWNFFLLA